MITRLLNIFQQELSPLRAQNHITEIYESDKFSSYSKYNQTTHRIQALLTEAGIPEAGRHEYTSDGKNKFGDWVSLRAWDPVSAELRVVEPSGNSGVLTRYPDCPCSLAMYSGSTPLPDGVTAGLIDIDIQQKADITGAICLTAKKISQPLIEKITAKGGLGIISDYMKGREKDLSHGVLWENDWKIGRSPGNKIFTFMISPDTGSYLRKLLTRTPVTLKAVVDASSYSGKLSTVTGVIPGKTDEEVLVLGHLCEIGANDDASGCGLGIEVMNAIQTAIRKGLLPQPTRSIRYHAGPECYGIMAFLEAHPEICRKTVAGICMDMVGENQNLCGSYLRVCHTPESVPSCTNDLITFIMEKAAAPEPSFKWKSTDFVMMDNLICDPSIGIPTPSLWNCNDRFYHSNLDTPDTLSLKQLGIVGRAVASYLYFLANPTKKDAERLADIVGRASIDRISTRIDNTILRSTNRKTPVTQEKTMDTLDYLLERETQVIDSVKTLHRGAAPVIRENIKTVRDFVASEKKAKKQIRLPRETSPAPEDREQVKKAQRMIPRRLVFGLITMDDAAPEEFAELRSAVGGHTPPWSEFLFNLQAFTDGKNSVYDIFRKLKHIHSTDLGIVVDTFTVLEKIHKIKITRKKK